MAVRVVLIAHAATAATRLGAFPGAGDDEDLERPDDVLATPVRAALALRGPERRCRRTAELLGWEAAAVDALADVDVGRWHGQGLEALLMAEGSAVAAWLRDPDARPPGGETIGEVVDRVGGVIDGMEWPEGRSVLVVSPLVVRAAIVHALGLPRSTVFSVDVPPLAAAVLSRQAGRWRLRALMPWPTWRSAC